VSDSWTLLIRCLRSRQNFLASNSMGRKLRIGPTLKPSQGLRSKTHRDPKGLASLALSLLFTVIYNIVKLLDYVTLRLYHLAVLMPREFVLSPRGSTLRLLGRSVANGRTRHHE
jgi:hypothetical protein